jgi:hypothetical protein
LESDSVNVRKRIKTRRDKSNTNLNSSASKILSSRNFSKRRGHEETGDLRQSSMSSNNSLYNNPGFVSVTEKLEQGEYLPYNYSEKKVIVPKTNGQEQSREINQLTTSQFSKLYRRELNTSTSVVGTLLKLTKRRRKNGKCCKAKNIVGTSVRITRTNIKENTNHLRS